MPALPRRRGLVVAVAAIAVVLLAELAARALAPYLEEPVLYGDQTTQVKVAQMDAIGSACTDVVVAGDSTARDAFDPEVFQEADPARRRAYNASLDAASPILLERWLPEEVVPRLAPTTVVIAVASLDVNENGAAARSAADAYEQADLTRTDVAGRAQARLVASSALLRHRDQLRDARDVWYGLQRLRAGTPAARLSATGIDGLVGASGEGLSRRSLTYHGEPGPRQFTRAQLLRDWSLDGTQVAAAAALTADLRARGITVVLAVLPVTGDYVGLHPNGRADFERFLAAMRDLSSTSGAPLVDLHDRGPGPEAFADTHHLNASGSTWFSTELPRALGAAGVTAAPRCAA